MLNLAELKELLAQPQKIVITTHHKPDGDALGSSLGLFHYLRQKQHNVQVITPTDYPYFLQWMPGNADVIIYTEKKEQSAAWVQQADLIFCLDFNSLSRINELGELVKASSAKKIMIDHHLDPENFDDFRHWNTKACSAAQLVYEFIAELLGDKRSINADVATCLYTGIMTDSGSFRFPTTTANVHRITADLIDLGADNAAIHQLVYDHSTENRLRFLGYCLSEKLEILPEFNTAMIAITRDELNRFNIITGDTEGIVNYALSITGIRLAAIIIERTDKVKLSLRSSGTFPANEICKNYFHGGGHRNAAGGQSESTLEQVIHQFKTLLPEYKNLLTQ
ncbi:DHH family phosphoesterase [Mucilaginibacter arboris]|uniref:Bifunctional oligoribonuclease/PAP phosphatase NrnA n=1 Tax=Mucilaginibacter arboris TaxID=2682090 RepID=A0A7K1SW83_9SPHI|nr:bifunctional oligoribonuclease/PAP phosphatase NrnA [Mucilaginibacter arboris]MVN21498.1 bifunctional oligoribonuclease/PAP phosphatase NrnA [Mucilaginibacter arboris]